MTNKIHNENQDSQKEPYWITRVRNAPLIVFVAMIVSAIIGVTAAFDGIGKIWDRFTTPQAFALAESTAKSEFSEHLAQRAWRRLFWADNFGARTIHQAPIQDIDDSWKHYIEADSDWSANLMISIVGLEAHYDRFRGRMLEESIQPGFATLDKYMAALRRSEMINDIRQNKAIDPKHYQNAQNITNCADGVSHALQSQMYILVRCFAPGDDTQKNLCTDNSPFLTTNWIGDIAEKSCERLLDAKE